MTADREPTYPLASWTLGGFRSIRDETTLELDGLNVLVGANSAGKSSVFHSLLMAAQTLGNPLADRALVLNGHLARLGLAGDIVHEESARSMTLGFSLASVTSGRTWRPPPQTAQIRVLARFAMDGDGTDFAVSEVDVCAVPNASDTPDQRLVAKHRTKTATREALKRAGLTGKAVEAAARVESYDVAGAIGPRVAGARLRQFLPEHLVEVANSYEQELAALQWAQPRRLRSGSIVTHHSQVELRRPVLDFLRRYVASVHSQTDADAIPASGTVTIRDLAGSVTPQVWQDLRTIVGTEWFEEHRSDLGFAGEYQRTDLAENIQDGIEFARRWFQNSVRHLGPLRAPPQPLYNLPEAASGTSVGRGGEYTAAVLSAYARRAVSVPDPNGQGSITTSLQRAVNTWVAKLGLLSAVRSFERGKLGYELHLNVEGVGRDLDLTTVGVGVSQALPIVVLGLIAEPGSLLLFEQPELHLHPDVQAALGDFFLALARTGRQLIIETHSEYLVNRLRRREATDPASGVADLVRLFFFERAGSASSIKTARIGPGGSMPDWPRGFLDTAAREVEAMVRPDLD